MSSIVFFIFALLMPWVLGFALVKPFLTKRCGYLLFALGAGYIVGWFVSTLILRFYDFLQRPFDIYEIILIECLVVFPLLFIKSRQYAISRELRYQVIWSGWVRLLFVLIMLLLIYRWGLTVIDLVSKPVLPWDGWYSWSAKAKAFYYANAVVPLYSQEVAFWNFQNKSVGLVGGVNHPYFISLIQTYTAMAWGDWNDGIVNFPWLGLSVATVLAVVGALCYLGGGLFSAILTSYMIISLPIFDTHISLGSYADVWVGVEVLIATCLLIMALTHKEWRLLLPFCFFLIVVYCTKHSAVVFLIALLCVVIWSFLGWLRSVVFLILLGGGYVVSREWLSQETFIFLQWLPRELQWLLSGEIREKIIAFNPVFSSVWLEWIIYDNWHYVLTFSLGSCMLLLLYKKKYVHESAFVLLIITSLLAFLVMLLIVFLTTKVSELYFTTIFNRGSLYFIPLLCFIPVCVFQLLGKGGTLHKFSRI